ncbi:GGDEF domain-containing protein [Propionivibrio dicarboxylicus]|nr:sensor domain-containing diguanylate cyclase [Propionivibrio dicarboxylicus]
MPYFDSKRQARQVSRLVIACTVLFLGTMWAAIGYFVTESRAARISEEQRVLARMARMVEEQTHALFSFVDYFLVAADSRFEKHPRSDPRTDPDFRVMMDNFRARTQGFVDIRFVSADGTLYYRGDTDGQGRAQVDDRDYYQAQMQSPPHGLFIAQPVLSRYTNRWGLPISYPLKARPHGIAVIFAAIENIAFSEPFEAARTKPNGSIVLVHQDGTILFRSPEAGLIGKSLRGSGLWNDENRTRNEGVFELTTGTSDGLARIGAFVKVPDYPLVAIATSSLDDTLSEWHTKATGLVAFGIAATLAGIAVLWRLRSSLRYLDSTQRELMAQANIDDLTQIANRRFFMLHSSQELERCLRYERPLSLLIYDVDHFKRINDDYGHETGDLTLKAITQAVQDELRATDLQARIGGEEFAVLLPETGLSKAVEVAERLRARIEKMTYVNMDKRDAPITVSVGIAAYANGNETLDELIARTDRALYRAKAGGRNRVCADFIA